MNKLTKGALLGSGAAAMAVGAAGALSYAVAHSIVRITLDGAINVQPSIKVKKLLSGCRQMELIEKVYKENASQLKSGDCKTVEISGYDGERLIGHLHFSANAKRTVIAMHGWRSTWANDFGAASKFFHANGCNVLYTEQRGQYNMGKRRMGFGITERYDCLSWIEFLNCTAGLSRLPIYLCGVSMGAATVLMTTGFKLPPNVVGVIADCGFTSPQAIWKHVTVHNLHMPYGKRQERLVRQMSIKEMELDPDGYSTVDALKSCKIPVLFIHGGKDRFVPIEMTYENYEACASEKRLFIVPEAEHGMSYFVNKNGYEAEIKRLWRDCDRRI